MPAKAKKILLVSSGQPSLNPRLVKEADALSASGYDVTVLYSYWNDWGTTLDHELIASKKWKTIRVGGDPQQQPYIYFLSRLIHKFAKLINRKTRGKLFPDLALARSAYFLWCAAKKFPADLYIGHNLGALPAVVKAAKKHKKPCGFDAEDFHRNEVSDNPDDYDVILKTKIEEYYLPKANYVTTSSPLIKAEYLKLLPTIKMEVILNAFPIPHDSQPRKVPVSGPIKLIWFSQTIGRNRGLEQAVEAVNALQPHKVELHLLGNMDRDFELLCKNALNKTAPGIFFHPPIPPGDLIKFCTDFDIGLALEPGFNKNNNIALSNKIFTYLQAGLCIIVSDTDAQKRFLQTYPQIGDICKKGDFQSLVDRLEYFSTNRNALIEAREAALDIARKELNWENERKKFLKVVEQTLNNN